MSEEREVWSYVAHRDGKYAGAIAGYLPDAKAKEQKQWRKEIAKFCGDFIAAGFEITRTYTREEYAALIKDMPVWESKRKKPQAEAPLLDLLEEAKP